MSLQLKAWFTDGLPNLEITDVVTGDCVLHWSYRPAVQCSDKKQLQNLFKKLLLLSLCQQSENARVYLAKPCDE